MLTSDLNNNSESEQLPKAKCLRNCVNFICWNAFSVRYTWLLTQQYEIVLPTYT